MAVALLLLLLACSVAAFGLFALSQPRNWALLRPNIRYPGDYANRLRSGGCGLLALGLCAAILRDGPAFGVMLWVLMLPIGAAVITAILSTCRR